MRSKQFYVRKVIHTRAENLSSAELAGARLTPLC
jgi:hypothetical protein